MKGSVSLAAFIVSASSCTPSRRNYNTRPYLIQQRHGEIDIGGDDYSLSETPQTCIDSKLASSLISRRSVLGTSAAVLSTLLPVALTASAEEPLEALSLGDAKWNDAAAAATQSASSIPLSAYRGLNHHECLPHRAPTIFRAKFRNVQNATGVLIVGNSALMALKSHKMPKRLTM